MLDNAVLAPHALARWAASAPDRSALIHLEGERLTYSQLLQDSLTWAACFADLGIDARTHVATLLPNCVDAYRVMLGLSWLRAVEIPLNVAYVGDMLRHALRVSEATGLVTSAGLFPRVLAQLDDLPALESVLLIDDQPALRDPRLAIHVLPERLRTAEPRQFPGPDVWDISSLLFTSGTTGPSKAVITPWGLTYQMWSWVPDDTLGPGERLFSAMPLSHNSGRSGFNYVLSRGGCLVTRNKFSATTVWDDVRRNGCVALALVGPLTSLLYSAPARDDDADNPVRSVILGPMIPQMEDFERRFGVRVALCYGQTEIGAPVTSTWDHGPWQNCGQERLTWPRHEVRLVDEHDEPVRPGEVGEMIVRTPEPWAMNLGYYGMPAESMTAWRNGWFHTGDAFRVDGEGRYYFVDRLRDTIRRRGENISSLEVETAVQAFAPVRECAAVGMQTEHGDEEVMVAVIADEAFDPLQLLDFLQDRLPGFMLPRYVAVVDELPRNATTGRVRKAELRELGLARSSWDRERAADGAAGDEGSNRGC